MKIAIISSNATPGLIIFRKDFIKYLISKKHTVYAFSSEYTLETRSIVKSFGAIPVDYSLTDTGLNAFRDIFDILKLKRQLKTIKPDVVLSFFVKPSIYGSLAAKLAGVPRRIAMLEGLGYIHTPSTAGFSFKKRVLQSIHGLMVSVGYGFANHVMFLNHDDPVDLSKKSFLQSSKFRVLGPIGLDLSAYPYMEMDSQKSIRFIFIGRLLAEKGVYEYLEAAQIVKTKFPNVEFVILGDLDLNNPSSLSKQELEKIIKKGTVIYPGHVLSVVEWIAAAHVFVLPSYREGLPRSTQEAMAIGRAVITTNVPGCRETVVEGVNGFIVPPFDALALVKKMIFMIENPSEIKRMGDESYRIAREKFDVDKINPVLANIILGINA